MEPSEATIKQHVINRVLDCIPMVTFEEIGVTTGGVPVGAKLGDPSFASGCGEACGTSCISEGNCKPLHNAQNVNN